MPRRWIALLATLAVLGVLLVLGDRAAAWRAEAKLEDRIGCRAGAADVHVRGFPVIPQLVGGTLDEVDITLDDLSLGGSTAAVDVRLHDVALRGRKEARQASLSATIPFDAVASRFAEDRAVTLTDDGGRLAMTSVSGRRTLLSTVSLVDGEIQVVPDSVRFMGQEVPLDVLTQVTGSVPKVMAGRSMPLPGLPGGLQPTSVAVTKGGLTIHAEGSNVAPGAFAKVGERGCRAASAEG